MIEGRDDRRQRRWQQQEHVLTAIQININYLFQIQEPGSAKTADTKVP